MSAPDDALDREFFARLMVARYDVDFVDDLLSDDPGVAGNAADEFGDILFQQGDISADSLAAVPRLVAALPGVPPVVRAKFIFLLGGIATALSVPGGDPAVIPRSTRAVFGHWNAIADRLVDPDFDVRLAALITLTDLARINLPQMRFGGPVPPFHSALPDGVEATDPADWLFEAINRSRPAFDTDWQQTCDVALAFLTFQGLSAFPPGAVHPYWGMLGRF